MEKPVLQIYQTLQKLVGFHRQMLDIVRAEKLAIVEANLKAIQEATLAKQGIIEAVRQAEADRLRSVAELSMLWKKPARDLTLGFIILQVQGTDPKESDTLRSALNTLTILIERVSAANEENRLLVQKSLEHVNAMKKNILGETVPKSNTYNQSGQKSGGMHGARLISKEA